MVGVEILSIARPRRRCEASRGRGLLRDRFVAVRFDHEEKTDGDESSHYQNHEKKDLLSRRFL
jgi:hypothetical protein